MIARLVNCKSFQSTPLREGRHEYGGELNLSPGFNPRPSVRGDAFALVSSPARLSFNPRPSVRGDDGEVTTWRY